MIAAFFWVNCALCEQDNAITVYYNEEIGRVNKKVFGNNFLGYDPNTYEDWGEDYYGFSDYGAGLWDPIKNTAVSQIVALAKQAGITTARFPGGCGAHHYNWRQAVGKERKHFLFGIDEFLKICEEIGAEPVLTLSYFTGNDQDAADLVKHLNSRAKYLEFGNEDWHGDHKTINNVSPEEYAGRYLRFYKKIKETDPSIKLGVILWGFKSKWDKAVLSIVKDKLDFASVHIYPEKIDFSISEYKNNLKDTLNLLKEKSGTDIPIAVTEYNLGLTQEKPVPYRHSLAAALVNAQLLGMFIQPKNNILMAHHWNFINEYWGMIYTKGDLAVKRPNYYVFELYNNHFGDDLIKVDYDERYLSVNAGKREGKVYLMVVNKNMDKPVNCAVTLKDFAAGKTAKAWILNGPDIAATNEEKPDNVRVEERELSITGSRFLFTFAPHSITAIEIQ